MKSIKYKKSRPEDIKLSSTDIKSSTTDIKCQNELTNALTFIGELTFPLLIHINYPVISLSEIISCADVDIITDNLLLFIVL